MKLVKKSKTKTVDMEIQLTKEMRFPYSGSAYITFPSQSCGHIVNDWDRVSFLPQQEREEMQKFCKAWNKIPCYVEGKLIALRCEDFEYSRSK